MLKKGNRSNSGRTDANGLFAIFIKPTDVKLFLELHGDIDSIAISYLDKEHRVNVTIGTSTFQKMWPIEK